MFQTRKQWLWFLAIVLILDAIAIALVLLIGSGLFKIGVKLLDIMTIGVGYG